MNFGFVSDFDIRASDFGVSGYSKRSADLQGDFAFDKAIVVGGEGKHAAEANLRDWMSVTFDWLRPHSYGLLSLEVNEPSLADFEVRIPDSL